MTSSIINIKEYNQYDFKLSYNPAVACIVMQIEGFMEGDIFKKNTKKMLDLLKQKKTHKVLVNAQKMKLIRSEDCEWLEKVFLPKASLEGFKACAFVKPIDYHARLSIENVIYSIPVPLIEAVWFDELEEAQDWLMNI